MDSSTSKDRLVYRGSSTRSQPYNKCIYKLHLSIFCYLVHAILLLRLLYFLKTSEDRLSSCPFIFVSTHVQ